MNQRTVYRLVVDIQRWTATSFKVHNSWRFKRASIEAQIEAHSTVEEVGAVRESSGEGDNA